MAELTLVFGYRDREPERVRRSLDSLAHQTVTDFRVIFVDYGSSTTYAQAVRAIAQDYPFADYIYNDTRGWPWNRSHALNTGVKLAQTPYLMTTDIDMIFAQGFVKCILAAQQNNKQVTHAKCHFLPEGFANWNTVASEFGKHELSKEHGTGGNMTLPTAILHQANGFDEYYRYWGVEDRDLFHRLTNHHGLGVTWMPDDQPDCAIYHQWHPLSFNPAWNTRAPRNSTFSPGVWSHLLYRYYHFYYHPERNPQGWGQIYSASDRPAFRYIDPDTGQWIQKPTAQFVASHSNSARMRPLLDKLLELESGQALLLGRVNMPHRYAFLNMLLRSANWFLNKVGSEIDYSFNVLADSITWILMEQSILPPEERLIADYYWGLPDLAGSVLLVRR